MRKTKWVDPHATTAMRMGSLFWEDKSRSSLEHISHEALLDDDSMQNEGMVSCSVDSQSGSEASSLLTPETYSNHQHTTVQMVVSWRGSEDFRTSYKPDPDACAIQAAQQELYWLGHQHRYHSLQLLSNETLGQRCTEATGWEQLIWGKAVVQVTLLSEPPRQPLGWTTFQRLEKMFGRGGQGGIITQDDIAPNATSASGTLDASTAGN